MTNYLLEVKICSISISISINVNISISLRLNRLFLLNVSISGKGVISKLRSCHFSDGVLVGECYL